MYDLNIHTMRVLYHRYLKAMEAAVRSSPYFALPDGTYLHNSVTNQRQLENEPKATVPFFGGGQAYQLEEHALTDDQFSVQATSRTCTFIVRGRHTETKDFIPTYSQYPDAPSSLNTLPFVRQTVWKILKIAELGSGFYEGKANATSRPYMQSWDEMTAEQEITTKLTATAISIGLLSPVREQYRHANMGTCMQLP
jgi:hypothetical protein